MRPLLATLIAALTLMGGVWALAAPGDPFGGDDQGFVPTDSPNGPITKCETRVGNAVGRLAAGLIKCHILEASGKLTGDAAEDVCETTAKNKFAATNLSGCAPCTNLTGLGGAVEGVVDINNNKVYCTAGGTPFGGDDTGNIPPDAPSGPKTKCANVVEKAAGKLLAGLLKCHSARASGKLVNDTTEDACETTAKGNFGTKKTAGCDPCVNLTTIGNTVESALDAYNGLIYCDAPTTTTTTSSTTTTTGPPTCANGGIAWGQPCGPGCQGSHGYCYAPEGSGFEFIHCGSAEPICIFSNFGYQPAGCTNDAECAGGACETGSYFGGECGQPLGATQSLCSPICPE
jgi:hypothetical protein